MNEPEVQHVFPIPEMEKHKLEEVEEEILHPMARRSRRFIRTNIFSVIALSLTAGVLCGLVLGRRG